MDTRIIYIIFMLNLAALSAGLAFFAWKRREKTGARSFAALMLATTLLSLPYAAELASSNLEAVVFWSKLEYFGLVSLPVTWLIFAFEYTGNHRWLKQRNLILWSIIPAITLLLALTNESHQLIWQQVALDDRHGFPRFDPTYGFFFWIFMIYTAFLVTYGSLALLRKALMTWSVYRRQSLAIILGTVLPLIGSSMLVTGVNPFPIADPLPIFFNLGCICFAWAVFRLSMLDFVPVAYEDVIESLPDGVLTVDINHRVTAYNSVIRPFLSRRSDKIITQPLETVFEENHPQYGEIYHAREARTEIDFSPQKTIEVRVSPLYNRRKQFMGRLLLFRDITSQKHAETFLNQRVEQLNILRQAYEEIASTLNLDKILTFSLEAAVRLSKSQAGYLVILDQDEPKMAVSHGYNNPDEDTQKIILKADSAILKRVTTSRRSEMILDVFRDRDYSPFLLDTKAKMVVPMISQNTLIGVMNLETPHANHYTQDIFDLLQILSNRISAAIDNANLHNSLQNRLGEVHHLYQKLSHLEQLKTDMIRMAAHDIRNPLAVIANALEMMEDEVFSDEIRQIYLTPMQSASQRIERLSQNILSLEQIEQMALGVNMQRVNLADHARQAAQEQQPRAAQKTQEMIQLLNGDSAYVRGDATQLYEAMSNLITNAIKYTPTGGKITIRLFHEGSDIIFKVEDTGMGISEEHQMRLFQPFFRVKTTDTAEIEGTGLGLHLVKNIVDRHNGKIIFHSQLGQGSTFGFRLPTA